MKILNLSDHEIDKIFNIPSNLEIESSNYSDLENEALLTSYHDYLKIFSNLGDGKTIIDLGAGFCRGTLIANYLNLNIKCLSVEIDFERVNPAIKYLDSNEEVYCGDIMDDSYKLPMQTDAIFLYIPSGLLLYRVFELLTQLGKEVIIYVIESHGQLISNLDLLPSIFKGKEVIDSVYNSRHDSHIYRYIYDPSAILSKFEKETYQLMMASLNKNFELHTNGELGVWLAPSFGMEFLEFNGQIYIQTIKPNRLLNWDGLKISIHNKSKLCKWFESQGKEVLKVYMNPKKIELLSGKFVEFNS